MWYNTKAAELLGIQYPILQGPFGGSLSSVELVATVSNMGGLGGYGAYTMSPNDIYELDKQIKTAVKKGISYAMFIGEKELDEELYEIRNLATGVEERHSASRIFSIVKDYRDEDL